MSLINPATATVYWDKNNHMWYLQTEDEILCFDTRGISRGLERRYNPELNEELVAFIQTRVGFLPTGIASTRYSLLSLVVSRSGNVLNDGTRNYALKKGVTRRSLLKEYTESNSQWFQFLTKEGSLGNTPYTQFILLFESPKDRSIFVNKVALV